MSKYFHFTCKQNDSQKLQTVIFNYQKEYTFLVFHKVQPFQSNFIYENFLKLKLHLIRFFDLKSLNRKFIHIQGVCVFEMTTKFYGVWNVKTKNQKKLSGGFLLKLMILIYYGIYYWLNNDNICSKSKFTKCFSFSFF